MSWNIFGHRWAEDLLRSHIKRGQVRQAYLLTGPPGVGRRTLGLRFAQALNCRESKSPGDPCRSCSACLRIERMEHPDLFVVQAEKRGGVLKVDQIRELQYQLALAPYEGRYKIALLLRFQEANDSAMNSLLKTLEEPTSRVVILLTADNRENLLPTIVSRCEVFPLRPMAFELLGNDLAERYPQEADYARQCAHISGGRPGYALRLLQDPSFYQNRATWITELLDLLGTDRIARFAFADTLAKESDRTRDVLLIWLSFWRDVLLASFDADSPVVNVDFEKQVRTLAEQHEPKTAMRMVQMLERTIDRINGNVNNQLALEVLMLDMPEYQGGD